METDLYLQLCEPRFLYDAWLRIARKKGAGAALSRLCISVNAEKSGIGNLEEGSVVFLGHKINSVSIDASAKGWKRFADALVKLENARNRQEAIDARALLSNLKSFYRSAGKIG